MKATNKQTNKKNFCHQVAVKMMIVFFSELMLKNDYEN